MDNRIKPLPLSNIRITDPFWTQRRRTARDISIPYMLDALYDRIPNIPKSHCIENFRIAAGLAEGQFEGFVFQDSDLYKALEAIAYSLMTDPDPALEATCDELIELVGKAQQPDGYLDTHYIIGGLDKRWTNLRGAHEMYVAGHMMEAAVAYLQATGKDALLRIACRFADHIDQVFGPGEDQKHGYPGHQEIEIGLVKLYEATGEARYLKLAAYFLLERGKQPYYFDIEAKARGEEDDGMKSFFRTHGTDPYSYQQAHKPVLEQTEAVGHAVRVGYMLAAMADVAALTGDEQLLAATRALYEDVVNRQMYIIGGIGSMGDGEAFTFDYDIPNDRMYTETCAAISLLMTAQRLGRIEPNAQYADICERALYNGILSGVSLDGTKFFYTNPMEMWPERAKRRHDMGVDSERQGWYGCACCPPNLVRTVTSLGQYIYGARGDELYVHQFIGSTAEAELSSGRVTVAQQGNYPWDGALSYTIGCDQPTAFALMLRIPAWCEGAAITVNGDAFDLSANMMDGYARVQRTFKAGDVVRLTLPMPVQRVYCNDAVPFNAGKVALTRGPLVYCIEEQDNGTRLWNISLPEGEVQAVWEPAQLQGVTTLRAKGVRTQTGADALYSTAKPESSECDLTFIPYYSWCNRVPGEMTVWVRG